MPQFLSRFLDRSCAATQWRVERLLKHEAGMRSKVPSSKVLAIALALLATVCLARPLHAAPDVVQFATNIDVPHDQSTHDVVCIFCNVTVDGSVNGDLVVLFGNTRIVGRANHDVVSIFGNVDAGDDSAIGEDLVSLFGNVRLGENVHIGEDAVVLFGALHAPASASIGGDRTVQPAWIFWTPVLLIILGLWLLVHEIRAQRRRRMMRGY